MHETMHGYYSEQDVMPTHGSFATTEDLDAYETQRRRLFTDKLLLPPRVFGGARLLEFGPDTGENALVFARWGASCTLSEPHARAHAVIRDYFDRFGLTNRLAALEAHELERYPQPEAEDGRFDVVDAEGFVNAIQPPSAWIDTLPGLVRADGLVILFYMELYGCLFELTWKVVQARYRALTGAGPTEAAERLFATKWGSIPHKRSIASWTMDVLENPFVRLKYFLDAKKLCELMHGTGFRLYSSWPPYGDSLDVHWFKRELTDEELFEQQLEHIERSRLSYLLGRKHFLVGPMSSVEGELGALVQAFDELVDAFSDASAARADSGLARVAELLDSEIVFAAPDARARSAVEVGMLRRLLETLAAGQPDEIAAFCNEDAAFNNAWGLPSHFAVFRRSR